MPGATSLCGVVAVSGSGSMSRAGARLRAFTQLSADRFVYRAAGHDLALLVNFDVLGHREVQSNRAFHGQQRGHTSDARCDTNEAEVIRRPLHVAEEMLSMPRPHRRAIASELPLTRSAPVQLPPTIRVVFLCFTNRCGSNHLGDLLSSTGMFERPDEALNAEAVLPECRQRDIRSFPEYFEHIVRRDAKGDLYIVKSSIDQIILLSETGILDQIIDRTDFLFLRRTDKIAQAISRTISDQNRRFSWAAPALVRDDELVYSFKEITWQLRYVIKCNSCFDEFFSFNGLAPINVEYERLVNDPQTELDEILRRLRLPRSKIDASKLWHRRQSDHINQAWRLRFLSESTTSEGALSEQAPVPGEPVVPESSRRQSSTPEDVMADILVHIRNIGDFQSSTGSWIGTQANGLWIEGFSITPQTGLALDDIEYAGIQDPESPPPWASGGSFSGSRGLSMPLLGLCVRLRNAAAEIYQFAYSAAFVDGSTIGPVTAGQVCQSPRLAALCAFRLTITPASPWPSTEAVKR